MNHKLLLTPAKKSPVFVLLFLSNCLFCSPIIAQNFIYAKGLKNSVPYSGSVGATSIKVDNFGNSYVTGYFTGTADFDPGTVVFNLTSHTYSSNDIFLAKYDPSGKLLFAKGMGGSANAQGTGIAIDGSGNIYVTGNFMGSCDFDPGAGIAKLTCIGASNDIFVAKYNTSGNYVYAIAMGGKSDDYGRDIDVDISGNAYVAGNFSDTIDFDPGIGLANLAGNAYNSATFIAKYDPSGNYVFAKGVGDETNGVQCKSIALDISGNAYVTGFFSGTVDFDPGADVVNLSGTALYIAKYDASGNYVYAKSLSTSSAASNSIDVDASGNVCVTGYFNETMDFDPGASEAYLTGAGGEDIFIASYDASGNYRYAKAIGGIYSDHGLGIDVDALGNASVTGYFSSTVDFDPGAGTMNLTADGFGRDIFVARYNASGDYVYAKAMSGSGEDHSDAIAVDGSGKVYFSGAFSQTTDFDPGTGTANLTIGGTSYNAFVSSLSDAGNYAWANQIGTYIAERMEDHGSDIAVDALGNTYVTGSFSGTVDFDPGPGIANLTSIGSYDIFVAKYDDSGNYLFAISMGGTNADRGNGIAIDGSGNVFVTGSFANTADFDPGSGTANLTGTGNRNDIFIAKYDASLHYIYAKSMEGDGEDVGNSIGVDPLGNIYITGSFAGIVDFDPGPGFANRSSVGGQDIFVARYDASGNYLYARSIGFSASPYADDAGNGIAVDGSGNAFVIGSYTGGAYDNPVYYIFLAKFNTSGNYVYSRSMAGTATSNKGYGIAVDGSGNAYITGSFGASVDFDPGPSVASLTSAGYDDIFFAKYNATGQYVYAKSLGSTQNDAGYSIAVEAPSGKIYITGFCIGTVDFDPGAGEANHTSEGRLGIFIANYDASGSYLYSKAVSGLSSGIGYGIAVDGSGNVYGTGFFLDETDFDPGGGSPNSILIAHNYSDIFIAKYGPSIITPIELFSFTAKPIRNGASVQANWSVASQINNAWFEVERSTDGVSFESIGRRAGCACTSLQQYELTDENPYTGISYYRLKQVDYNNKFTYSQVVMVEIGNAANTTLLVYPNITADAFKAIVKNSEDKRQVVIQLINAEGRLVKQQMVWLDKGDNTFNYSLSDQAKGVYYINVSDQINRKVCTAIVIKK